MTQKNPRWPVILFSLLPMLVIAGGKSAPQTLLQHQENPQAVLLQRIQEALVQQAWDSAEMHLKELIALSPKQAEAQLALAAISLRRGAHEQSRQALAQAFALAPQQADIMAAYLQQQFIAERRESMIKEALASHPSAASLYQGLGNTFAEQKRWREAQEAYRSALSLDPENPDHHLNLAISHDELRQYPEAIQHYQEALRLAREHPPMFFPESVLKRLEEIRS